MATHTTQTLSYFSASEKRIQMKHILFSFPETKLYDREYTIKIYAVDSTWREYKQTDENSGND